MKITIAYLPGEKRESDLILHFVKGLCPGAKVRKSDRHPPFLHTYLITKKAKTRCNFKENT